MNEEERTLEGLLGAAEEQARVILLELKMPRLSSIWVLVCGDGGVEMVPAFWRDEGEKRRYSAKMRSRMRERRVTAYSFLTEAWTATLGAEEMDESGYGPRDGVAVKDRPGRGEVVIACACSATVVRWKQWRIVREATTERIVDLKERPVPESGWFLEGWLTEMLK